MKTFLTVLVLIVITSLLNTLIGGVIGYALLSFFFAIILFIGKGDNLIAGYNTSDEEEKEKCNIKRLRFLMGSCMTILGALLVFKDAIGLGLFIAAASLLAFVTVILANTWAMKK